MNYTRVALALLIGLAILTTVPILMSSFNMQEAAAITNNVNNSGPDAMQKIEQTTIATSLPGAHPLTTQNNQFDKGNDEACTIAVAAGNATTDGRPILWKNRDYYGRTDAWQSILFWHEATSHTFSISDTYGDRFAYVAVTDRGDWSDPQDVTETLYYPRMGANERGLAVVSAQAHTLSSEVQNNTVGCDSQDQNGIRNGGLNHWILSRCETITQVEQLLSATNDGGGYNGSTARDTASLVAVIDRFGGAVIFEVDGNSFARQNITHTFEITAQRTHSSGPLAGGYNGYDYRSNFSRITFTNTQPCSTATAGFPYYLDICTNAVIGDEVVLQCDGTPDGINDLENSTSSVKRWGRVAARIDDDVKDYQYFIQKWLHKGGQPREYYLETLARSVGYMPYLTASEDPFPTYDWLQEKSTGWHLNRFATVSSAVIVGSKAADQDEGRLTTMWVALGEPSVAIFVPVFPYAGEPPAVLDNFFLSINAKRRLVYDYETDVDNYPIDNIHDTPGYRYNHFRNADHLIDLSILLGGNYYGEGGLQAYNFAIEKRLFEEYNKAVDEWRSLPITQITPLTLTGWQEEWVGWAAEEYVKSDPTVTVYEAETAFQHTSGQITTSNTITAWQFSQDDYMCLSHAHNFVGPTIIEVVARGTPDDGDWPGMKVWISDTLPITLSEIGGETEIDYTVVVSPAHATNKAKSVSDDLIDTNSRFALYRYRTTHTHTSKLCIEVVSATVTATVDIDKVLLRTEPRSVEMYEVEKDWDGTSDIGVNIYKNYIRLGGAGSYFDTHHYIWQKPLVIEVVIGEIDSEPPWPEMGLYYTRTSGDLGWKQIGVTATVNTSYAVHSFYLPAPAFEGETAFRIQSGNNNYLRIDKLLVKEGFPSISLDNNTAPNGHFVVDATTSGPTMTITATAVVTDLDGDAIASYFWDFGDKKSYCSANPTVTHTYTVTQTPHKLILHATDHRGKTGVFSQILMNHTPIADAGSDQSADALAMVTLDGSASSDPDGDYPLTYHWIQGGGPQVTFTPNLSMTTFTAPLDSAILTFTLAVTDSLGLPDPTPDEAVITVRQQLHHIYLPLIVRQ